VAHDYSFATERLLLRPFADSDFAALLAIESRADVARWQYGEPRHAEAVREVLARKLEEITLTADGDWLSFAAVQLEHEWKRPAPSRARSRRSGRGRR
jgi:RimJ/RimL family protein N-acetyltransferase